MQRGIYVFRGVCAHTSKIEYKNIFGRKVEKSTARSNTHSVRMQFDAKDALERNEHVAGEMKMYGNFVRSSIRFKTNSLKCKNQFNERTRQRLFTTIHTNNGRSTQTHAVANENTKTTNKKHIEKLLRKANHIEMCLF